MQSGKRKLNMLRAVWCPLKTRDRWTADRQRCTRKEMGDGAAQQLLMEGMHPVCAVGREGFGRVTHGGDAPATGLAPVDPQALPGTIGLTFQRM